MIDAPLPHSAHWGAFSGRQDAQGRLVVRPHPADPDPSPILANIPDAVDHRARVARPMVRRGWLEHGPGTDGARGRDDFVAVEWPEALDLVATELARVRQAHGPGAIFGGSYGWSSAGRFHHAQSQLHRFLNLLGGYVRSVNTYSAGASVVILPHVIGPYEDITRRSVSWAQVTRSTDLVLAFGGMALKNGMVTSGGASRHVVRGHLRDARRRGTAFHLVGPLRDDMPVEAEAVWHSIVPGTDTALILALCHTLVADGLHDRAFVERYCEGADTFIAYLLGRSDGQPKDAGWAAPITGMAEADIAALARALAGRRTLVTVSHSLQRAPQGEQPVWAAVALAALLGQIGLDGGGFAYSLGALGNVGNPMLAVPIPTLAQGRNRVRAFIPCARIADMLLHPGDPFDYDGQGLAYPDIRLVYWAGGNPFHHHQDLNRLRAAFARPDTIIVHESAWTATARHADIVLPATLTIEREDIGAAAHDNLMIAMHRLVPPHGEARDDYAIFGELARRLGVADDFTEGRSARDWLRHLYDGTRTAIVEAGQEAPDFETFWARGELALPESPDTGGILRAFRDDPIGASLQTPSGRIELFSARIASFGYDDCPGHPAWLPPEEGPGSEVARRFPLQLVANQPATRLHSQLDFGSHSLASKIRGREPIRLHPADAAARGIAAGDIVRVHNHRGACLAAAILTEDLRPGVVQLSTGAWYDPDDPASDRPTCVHGNPNVLTQDVGTSRLAQGCTGQLTMVEVARFDGPLPPVRAFDPPPAGPRPPRTEQR